MKTHTFLYITIFFVVFNSYAQINFEKGYFITNAGERIECLIKNIDWKNNPKKITYKFEEESNEEENYITKIKEFGINGELKYVRKKVEIDRSTSVIDKMVKQRNPIFKTETLFLKVLVEGNGVLFYYKDIDVKRFFYSLKESSFVEQLIYKKYKISDYSIGKNELYRQQLLTKLKCDNEFSVKDVEKLNYKSNSLTNFFLRYNKCKGDAYASASTYKNRNRKKPLNLTIKLGINNVSYKVVNSSFNPDGEIDLGKGQVGRFGVETEYVLPFNKNKWSLILESTYQSSFKEEKTFITKTVTTELPLISKIDHESIEFSLGIKHGMFLNDVSKIYVTGSYVFLFNMDSRIKFERLDNSILRDLEINTSNGFNFSIGYQYKRYSLGFKYSGLELLNNNSFITSDYNSVMLTLGYRIF